MYRTDETTIKELINGKRPMAIVRFFEWPVFSKSDANTKYVLLMIDGNRLKEVYVPDKLLPFLRSRLDRFEQVFHGDDGAVWERMSFGDRVRDLVPRAKVVELINKC